MLFDYESNEYTVNKVNISSSGTLIRNDKKVAFLPGTTSPKNNYQKIGRVSVNIDEFKLKFDGKIVDAIDDKAQGNDRAWLVIKSTFTKNKYGYKLKEGEQLKLGKVLFKVKEISISKREQKIKERTQCENVPMNSLNNNQHANSAVHHPINNANENTGIQNNCGQSHLAVSNMSNNNLNINDNQNFINLIIKKNQEVIKGKKGGSNQPLCRICLNEDNEADNPLFGPCKCSGSMKHIHLLCLRNWFKSKITTKVCNFLIVHSFRNLECEICKAVIPEKVKIKGTLYTVIDLQRPESNYIMLESMSKERSDTRYLYIIHMKEKSSITLGRANESDVRISDISVSRSHAFLKLINNNFYLEDNSSKFGTLILTLSDITFLPYRQISLQMGKCCLHFNLNKTMMALLCCYSKSDPKYDFMDYNDLFDNEKPSEREAIPEYNESNNIDNNGNLETPRQVVVLEEDKINEELHNSQEKLNLIDNEANQVNAQEKIEKRSARNEEAVKEMNETLCINRRESGCNFLEKKESDILVKDQNTTNLNATNIFPIEDLTHIQHSEKKNYNNYLPNENNNYEQLEEIENTMNKTFKQAFEEVPVPNEIVIITQAERKPGNKERTLIAENLQELMQSQILNTLNNGVQVNMTDIHKEEYPDQNLIFSNLIKFEVKGPEEKEDLNNLTHVFVDKMLKRIKSENFDMIQAMPEENKINEDTLLKGRKSLKLNLSDNIGFESIDESKIISK